MMIVATLDELIDGGRWDQFCEDKGWNVWCVNEGLASSDEKVTLSLDEAKRYNLLEI